MRSAVECEQWAAQHPGDPDEPRALLDAGWLIARGSGGGGGERALELFRRAVGFGGETGRDAQVGIVEQLYELGRAQEADEAQRSLRAELDDQPGGVSDLRVFNDMAEMLIDAEHDDLALEWCQAGLDRADEAGDDPQVEPYRRELLITQRILLEGPDADLDDDEIDNESLAQAMKLIDQALNRLPPGRALDVPRDGSAFNGIVLRWAREDFTAARSRYPRSTEHYGDDYDAYTTLIQREARSYRDAGAAQVHLVTGSLDGYEAYALREGLDPAAQATRQGYGRWCVATRPDRVRSWPPDRNGACWCDSGRKYKKCCGTPAKN